ncbi:FtsX-like permease family protein [Demequina sp. SYSU T00039]|uniref:FtsX-like permease family protein n=1 Tax=Demequina lignilytica TaxID=3051663 RepID=A0AAW7M3S4_9MICO|nr:MULTISPECIES: ABC transporter permease [unclassified Demequina]MDN4478076.1 FtsX-like permease family protein [Demequina sp. SYSU T00039-1]MDN4488474.1 FtsX-like permease family protein [Demequina sp. SYSU T00039]
MFRLAVKSVRHNPKRLVLTAIAVALGVTLVAATLTLTNALSSGFSQLFEEIYAGTDVIVEQDPAAVADDEDPFAAGDDVFTAESLEAIRAIDGVERAEGGIQVMGSVLAADFEPTGDLMGAGGAPSQIFNWAGDPRIDQATLVEGVGPAADDEIVLDLDAAPRLGYEIGDTVMVATESGVSELTLVGLVRFGESNSLQGATLAYLTEDAAAELAGADGYQQISVIVAEGADAAAVADSIGEVLPDGTRAITGEDKAAEQTEALDEVFQYIDIFAIAFALIALFVGSYIIVNTFRIIVTQRTREFGLMRAIGVTGRQLRSMILLEAVVIAIVASTVGLVVGYLGALGLSALVERFTGDLFGTVTLPLDAVLASYVLGAIVTIASALLPAIHASTISPMEALREAATESKKPLARRNIVGAAMALLGVVAITVGLYMGLERPYIYVGVGAVLLVLGVTLLAAQVLVPLAYALKAALTRVFRVDGKLAANNIRREPRRSANTAAALMIGVMLLALVATFTESLKSVVSEQFAGSNADFFVVNPQGPIPPGALEAIEAEDGVAFVTSTGLGTVTVDGTAMSLAVIDPDTAEQAFDYNNEPDFDRLDGGVFIDPTVAETGVEVGDELTLEGSEGSATLTVTGEYLNAGDAQLWVDEETGAALLGEVEVFQSMVVLDDGVDATEMRETLLAALADDFPLVALQTPDAFQQLANQFIDLLLGVISALLGAALIVAILGVANTLLLSVTERTREIGLLRAVGVRRSSVWRMITIESMVMSVFGTILGMILGVGLGAALVLALEEFGFSTVTVPWGWLAFYTVAAAIAGVVAAIWPAWRASRMDILQAIATDG